MVVRSSGEELFEQVITSPRPSFITGKSQNNPRRVTASSRPHSRASFSSCQVINAGRFDQRTTQEERRITLEALLHDEDRYQQAVHDVLSMREINRKIARTDEELELFDKMDEEEVGGT